jgi:hypothetical protein
MLRKQGMSVLLLAASSLCWSAAHAKDDVCEVVKRAQIDLQTRPASAEILVPVKVGVNGYVDPPVFGCEVRVAPRRLGRY